MNLKDIFQNYNTNITIDISDRIIHCLFNNSTYIDLLNEFNLKIQYNIYFFVCKLSSNSY